MSKDSKAAAQRSFGAKRSRRRFRPDRGHRMSIVARIAVGVLAVLAVGLWLIVLL